MEGDLLWAPFQHGSNTKINMDQGHNARAKGPATAAAFAPTPLGSERCLAVGYEARGGDSEVQTAKEIANIARCVAFCSLWRLKPSF